jgi:integrase
MAKVAAGRRNVKSDDTGASVKRRRRRQRQDGDTVDSGERGKDYLTEGEVERLRAAARKGRHGVRDDLIVLLLYRHGLRVSELVALRRNDVRLGEGRMTITRLKGGLSVEQPLTGEELRRVKHYLRSRDDALSWLVLSERATPLTRQAVNYLLARAGERAGLGHVHPHMLRHGCGYHLANAGHDTRLIQDYLGHRDPRHTARYTRTAAVRFEGLWKR